MPPSVRFPTHRTLMPAAVVGLALVAVGVPAAGAPPIVHREVPDDPPAASAARDDAAARTPGRRVQAGPYVSVQVNVDEQGRNIVGDAANEPSIAVDPVAPGRMVIGWRQFDNVASNFRQAGWAYSHDGGASWTFPGVLQPGIFRSDPVLDVDGSGTVYYNSLQGDFDMDVFRSHDGGLSWLAPVPAWGGDKNWMTVDRSGGPGEGHVYGTWQRPIGCCGPDIFTRSVDGGASFESPVMVSQSPAFGVMAVGPDGEVYAAGVRAIFFQEFETWVVARSDNARDSGATPSFSGTVVNLGGSMVLGAAPNPEGLLGQAWVAVDRSSGASRGDVYLLASLDPPGGDPMDVRIARSTDGGATWEPAVRVNDDGIGFDGNWQWFGTLSVAPNRRLDVVWNDTRASGLARVSELYYSYSYDGGKTWAPNVAASPAFDSSVGWPNQNKLGDYYDMRSDDLGADVAYAATFNGEQDVYYLRVFPDCNDNGVSDVADIIAGDSDDADGDDIPDECDDAVLMLALPDPGLAGQTNTFLVSGATPGGLVGVAAGLAGGSTAVPGCPGLTVAIGSPRLLGTASADDGGEAAVAAFLPEQLGGRTLLSQAVDRTACTTSALVAAPIE